MNFESSQLIRFGHSPDADDAFMFYGFSNAHSQVDGFQIEHVIQDIQSLNQRALLQADLEVTAISAAIYPRVAHKYAIMATGASMGNNYGPILISKNLDKVSRFSNNIRFAIPGEQTTAFLLLKLYLKDLSISESSVQFFQIPFDQIIQSVISGQSDIGLIIHEGQLTYGSYGLQKILDLGVWWQEKTNLSLPLGVDVVRRDLGSTLCLEINRAFRSSIECAFSNEENALDYALSYSRGLDREICRQFIRMYVNESTLNMGGEGLKSLNTLFEMSFNAGFATEMPPVDIVGLEL